MRSTTRHLSFALAWLGAGLALFSLRCGPIGSTVSPPVETGSSGGSSSGSASSGGSSGGKSSSSGGGSSSGGSSSGSPPTSGLHVSGNKLVDNGQTVRLLGVNKSGTEYQCVHNQGIFDGPSDTNLVTPMKSWNINTVRVPLNEDCWLGINGVNSAYSGSTYVNQITSYVQMLRQNGMYVIVDLHWNATGTTQSTGQEPMPDEDHAGAFWTSVATAFKGDNGILFDLYNEPHPDDDKSVSSPGNCLLNGCSLSIWKEGGTAMAAGMQELTTKVRATGAQNIIMIAGWSWAGMIGQIMQYLPNDPINNLAVSFHTYDCKRAATCCTSACWQANVANVAAKYPVITGELGETDCASSYINQYFTFADGLGISYLGWTWNNSDCSSVPSLITTYAGNPTMTYGQGFMTHLQSQ
jgi:hypothetical protein